jgi:hypothetical protein
MRALRDGDQGEPVDIQVGPAVQAVSSGTEDGVTAEARTSWLTWLSDFMGESVCDEDADGLTYVTAEVQKELP